jgi:hypothetical protein
MNGYLLAILLAIIFGLGSVSLAILSLNNRLIDIRNEILKQNNLIIAGRK